MRGKMMYVGITLEMCFICLLLSVHTHSVYVYEYKCGSDAQTSHINKAKE